MWQIRRRRPSESRTAAERDAEDHDSIAYLPTTIAAVPGGFVASIRAELLEVPQLVAAFGDAIGAHQRRGRLPIRLPVASIALTAQETTSPQLALTVGTAPGRVSSAGLTYRLLTAS